MLQPAKLQIVLPALLALITAAWSALIFPHAATSNSVLFDREIVRILDAHCAMCHMDGGPADAIITWEQAWLDRRAIHDAVLARHMPPWAAVDGYGNFKNANRLTLREKRFVVSWVEGLGPRNNGEVFYNVPGVDGTFGEPVKASFDTDNWRLGEPDRVVRVALADVGGESLEVPGLVEANVLIDSGIRRETFLTGLEFLPDARSELHAVVFSLADSGQWLATWTPWYGFRGLPEGSGIRLAPGQQIQADYVFAGDGDSGLDVDGRLGLHLSAAPPARELKNLRLETSGRGERLRVATTLDIDTTITALWPELPAGTRSLEVTTRRPDGRVEILLLALDIPDAWPTSYLPESPVTLPGGTVLTATVHGQSGQNAALSGTLGLILSTH